MAEEERTKCIDCDSPYTSLGPCPYAEDIEGDDTPVWLCFDCRESRADEI